MAIELDPGEGPRLTRIQTRLAGALVRLTPRGRRMRRELRAQGLPNPRRSRRRSRADRLAERHPRLTATLGMAGIGLLTAATVAVEWSAQARAESGWAWAVAAGSVFSVANIAFLGYVVRQGRALRRTRARHAASPQREPRSRRELGKMTIGSMVAVGVTYLGGMISLRVGAASSNAVALGLIATTVPLNVLFTVLCGYLIVRPPYRSQRVANLLRTLSRKV